MKLAALCMFMMSSTSFRESEIVFETMWADKNETVVEVDGFDPVTKTFYAKLKRSE